MTSPTPVLILGTRPGTEVLADLFECLRDRIRFVGAVENRDPARVGQSIACLPIHWHGDIAPLAATHRLVCALSTTLRAAWIAESQAMGFAFATLVHPSSVVSARTGLGEGTIIDALCVVAGFSEIAPQVRIGRRASIGHHTAIGPCSTVHPGAVVSGHCRLGAQVTVGAGAVITDGVTIGDGAIVGPGAVVRADVPARALVAGNPARLAASDHGPR
jgi:sugar O-acyltransferase (sialic acid O-acetyltransferase NeuD family)